MSSTFNQTTGVVSAAGGSWKEGSNSIELRAADEASNAATPLVWSVTLDTQPPSGTILINANAQLTTSVHVSLQLSADDGTVGSGVKGIRLSNDALTGFVEEPYVAVRSLWRLNAMRGMQRVYVKFVDKAGNESAPVSDDIELVLLSPETVITTGPAGFAPERTVSFAYMCPEGDCLFSYAFDNEGWSERSADANATKADIPYGNHYFRVKAAKEVNSQDGIQADEEDPSPAQRMWIVGVEPRLMSAPKGPPIKLWRVE
jgi:hypothetical protein